MIFVITDILQYHLYFFPSCTQVQVIYVFLHKVIFALTRLVYSNQNETITTVTTTDAVKYAHGAYYS